MWKFRIKKNGFTIIEVMCSLSVFTILFLTAMYIRLCTIKMQVYDDKVELYTEYIQDVKTEILSDLSNSQLDEILKQGKMYISNEKLNEEYLKNNNVDSLFTTDYTVSKPYLQMSAINGDIEKITLIMHVDILGTQENVTTNFYKGNYQ